MLSDQLGRKARAALSHPKDGTATEIAIDDLTHGLTNWWMEAVPTIEVNRSQPELREAKDAYAYMAIGIGLGSLT